MTLDKNKKNPENIKNENKKLKFEVDLLNSGYFQLKKTTEKLKESEEKFFKAFENSPYIIIISRVKDGKIINVNSTFNSILGFTKKEIINNSIINLKFWVDIQNRKKIISALKHGKEVKEQEFLFRKKGGEIITGLFSAKLITINKELCLISSVADVTELKNTEKILAQKNRILQMLSASNQALIHSTNEKQLLQNVCRNITKIGGYKLAWVGFIEYDKNKTIRPIAQAGFENGYVASAKLTWANTERGRGPGGIAARTGKIHIVKNILTDKSMAPWRKDAIKRGYNSTIFLPLIVENKTIGVLGIYSTEIDAFNEDEVLIIKELADDLSFGVSTIRTQIENIKIQEALVTSEAKYRSLFENARDGLIILDAKTGEIKEINYYLIELLGYGPNKFLRKKLWQINLFKDIVNTQKSFNILKTQKYKRFENIPLKTEAGKKIYVEFISNIYPSDRSGVIQCNIRDVTERRDLEEQVIQSEKRYSTLVESSNDAVVLIQDGIIKYANPAISNIINLTPNDVIGKPMANFIDPKYSDLVIQHYKNRILGNKIENRYEFAVINGRGETVPVETNSSLISFEGQPASMSVIRDISRAKEIDRIKSDFISVASHQLRTPLTGIKWFSQLLINQKIGRLSKKQTDFIAQIYNSNERMIRLVNDLLDVSHIESGQKFNIEKKPGNIITLIDNVIKDQKLNTPNKKLEIILDKKCPKELDFNFDADKIYQVFSNLISNSIKYSGQQVKIVIGASCLNNEAQFFVKDFGLGIPNNQKDRVFQKFFRADNISTISTEGTGLGLYIVKGIIEAHGGKVWFDSKESEGTTFYFTLPLKS
jgi:PAS domain S-box-containing protein